MSTLRNLDAIGKMLSGEHKFQTRKTFGFSDAATTAERNKKREVGEVWYEDTGDGGRYRWEQKKGYRTRTPANFEGLDRDSLLFDKCYPDCEKKTKGYAQIDYKIAKKTGMCLDCLSVYETRLRMQGRPVFDAYALQKMRDNALAFFKDADQEVEDLARQLLQAPIYVNADGREEVWTAENLQQMVDRLKADYQQFKQKILQDGNSESGIGGQRDVDSAGSGDDSVGGDVLAQGSSAQAGDQEVRASAAVRS